MQFKLPKNDAKYHWTNHVVRKMGYYGLSPARVIRVIRAPKRAENGVAEGTVAVMQPAGSKKHPYEIWVMFREKGKSQKTKGKSDQLKTDNFLPKQKIVITAWRYPGVSPVRDQIPIPAEILAELREENLV
ncbi:MAG: hypothetical protein Q8P35_03120 [Candidatus Yanofskybacteria bacterium]|nr:hypothetical protein [Candidatus Yanofskybacteria bacterium]